uniref:Uncharacterized protein n=1 Tax=Arundo donax TaxID=35708 RepID=A0A0A8Z501_ARUDO
MFCFVCLLSSPLEFLVCCPIVHP